MNHKHLSPDQFALLNKGYDAMLAYMDSIAEDQFEAFHELWAITAAGRRQLEQLEVEATRAHLETCFAEEV